VAGKIGQGLKFDGVNDYVVKTTPSWDFTSNPAPSFSLSSWFKLDSCSTTNYGIGLTTASSIRLNTLGTNNSWFFQLKSGETSVQSSSGTCIPNTWQHLTGVYDSSDTKLRLYINGVLANTSGAVSGSDTSTLTDRLSMGIGAVNTVFTKGAMDDVRIYSRALSASEVKQLYNLGAAKVNTSQQGISTGGLVGWWTFEGKNLIQNVADSSGLGNTGNLLFRTLGYVSTSSMQVAGKIGQGLKFDGLDDSVYTSSDFIGTSAITVCAWMYPRGWGGGNVGRIIDNSQFYFLTNSAGYLASRNNTGATAVNSGAGSITLGKWYHACLSRTSAGIDNFYINGSLSGAANQNGGTNTASGAAFVTIGNLGGSSTRGFDGTLDDMRVYNRVLSAVEIKQIYNMGR
jgi:hypothetical protein